MKRTKTTVSIWVVFRWNRNWKEDFGWSESDLQWSRVDAEAQAYMYRHLGLHATIVRVEVPVPTHPKPSKRARISCKNGAK